MGGKGALITGITGQDGYYITKLLLEKGYHIWGILRPGISRETTQIKDSLSSGVTLIERDITLAGTMEDIIKNIFSNGTIELLEIYNLGAVSNLKDSFSFPLHTIDVNGVNITRILEAIRTPPYKERIRFCQASSTEMFGNNTEVNTEQSPFNPNSPYGASKLYAHNMIRIYRENYNIFACSSLISNHESPKRDENFVSRKITMGVSKILKGEVECLYLGNLEARRDWSHAKDIVYAMWLMLQNKVPDDFIISSNETHSVREFIERVFSLVQIEIKWRGEGVNEIGYNGEREYIKVSRDFYRSSTDPILGNSNKIRSELGWIPQYSFQQLIEEMVTADC